MNWNTHYVWQLWDGLRQSEIGISLEVKYAARYSGIIEWFSLGGNESLGNCKGSLDMYIKKLIWQITLLYRNQLVNFIDDLKTSVR